MERSVALQNLARKFKEENKRLRTENEFLRMENETFRQKVAQLEAERSTVTILPFQPRKRSVSVDYGASDKPEKRIRTVVESLSSIPFPIPISYPSSPSISSVESYPSPMSEDHPALHPITISEDPLFLTYPAEDNNLVRASTVDDTDSPFERFDCGFCDENTPCVCREILQLQVADRIGRPNQPMYKIDHFETPDISSVSASQPQPSILDNLPPYQPAVPLRRKTSDRRAAGANSIFPIVQQPSLPSGCSGDPRNCRACASDDFGKAFCDAVNNLMAASEAADVVGVSGRAAPELPTRPLRSRTKEMIPRDHVWKQAKSHPNYEFSDLDMLAEVVVEVSKYTGSREAIPLSLESATSEQVVTPFVGSGPSRLPALPRVRHHLVGVQEVPREALRAAMNLMDAKREMLLP